MIPKRIYTAILLIILLSPNIFYVIGGSDFSNAGIITRLGFFAFCASLILSPLAVMRQRYYFLLSTSILLLSPLEVLYLYLFDTPVSSGIIAAIFTTDLRETFEFLSNYWLYLAFYISLVSFYLWVCFKKIPTTYVHKKLRIAIPSTAVFLFALILSQQIWQAHKASSSTSLKQNMDAGFETLSLKFYKIFPISVFMKYADARSFQNGIKDYTKNTQRFKFNAWKKNDDSKEVYVVVIGETSRADHWEINGYNRNTNPLLAKEKNLVSFSDVASCGNLTSFCVPLLLTGLPPEKFNDYANHKSFLTAFKEAGFYTVWLSNQNTVNLGLPYPSDADSLVSLHTSFDYSNGYDEKLLPLLDNVLALNKPKILIVMHTLGSHFRYNYRYPKSFEKFTPAFRENVDYGLMNKSNLPTIINTYDNSILYTDYILSSVIKRLKKIETPASMLYISDHGENLCDDSRELFYHGSGYATKWETQVPFLVWYSDFYKQKDVINNLNKNKNKKISAVSFFPTVLGVAGIHYKGENPVLNLGDSNYFSPKVRMIINMDMKPVKYIN